MRVGPACLVSRTVRGAKAVQAHACRVLVMAARDHQALLLRSLSVQADHSARRGELGTLKAA